MKSVIIEIESKVDEPETEFIAERLRTLLRRSGHKIPSFLRGGMRVRSFRLQQGFKTSFVPRAARG